jgi:hypothetical protein
MLPISERQLDAYVDASHRGNKGSGSGSSGPPTHAAALRGFESAISIRFGAELFRKQNGR